MDRFDPFVKYADVYGDVINWEKDPMNKPQNQNKYFFSDGKTYYEQICKMLRLMSVFKQAFNQIYDNEDEIHSAWENFVDNLSATAVYGEEVGVNLTWTDTSVNFAFTIPGGQDGVGIQSIEFNSDYTMTITLTDGSTYTSTSLRGPQGEQGIQGLQGPAGPQGEPGSGLEILDVYATLQDLQTAHPTGSPGDAYQVGTAPSFTLYIWSASQSGWVPAGTISSAVPSSADPLMDGTASAGISDLYARGDHVHPTDTSRASAQDLQTVDDKVDAVDERVDDLTDFINTSQKLIDQSFVYRESPAEHDGLAVLDTIKGHTVKFNQLAPTQNYTNSQTDTRTPFSMMVRIPDRDVFYGTTISSVGWFKQIITITTNCSSIIINHNGSTRDLIIETMPYSYKQGDKCLLKMYVNSTDPSVVNGLSISNIIFINLTAIFGAGSEPATPEAFETWLSQNLGLLDYYAYTPGTLIPFKGTALETANKINLYKENAKDTTKGYIDLSYLNSDGTISSNFGWFISEYIEINSDNIEITLKNNRGNSPSLCFYNSNKDFISGFAYDGIMPITFTIPENASYVRFSIAKDVSDVWLFYGKELNISTLSLPINTYFPSGMKDAKSIYDELTSNKATTKIGSKTFDGSEEWSLYGSGSAYTYAMKTNLTGFTTSSNLPNWICDKLEVIPNASTWGNYDNFVSWSNDTTIVMGIRSITSVEAWKTYLQNNPITLYYELATPTEQDIDLDLSFKAYEGGTEQLLPVNGSTPTTSSLLADMTYFSINDAMDYILAKLDQVPSSITADINSLKTRMTSAEGDITSLSGRMTTAEGNISDNASDISDLQTSLDTLEGRVDTIETDYLKVVQRTLTIGNISAGGNSQGSMPVQSETGYDMIGIVGSKAIRGTFDSNYTVETGFRVVLSGSTNYVYYKIFNLNTSSAAENVELTVDILCKKQSI